MLGSAEETRDALVLRELREHLRSVAVLDPACGAGAFLEQAFELLCDELDAVDAALERLVGRPPFGPDRIDPRSNLFGVDILSESVEIAKLSLRLRAASRAEPLARLDQTLWSSDTLREEYPRRFDLIVSNPPWGADVSGWTDEEARARFPCCGEERDSYALFIIRAHELLEPGGVIAYITPNSWLTVRGYAPFRRWFLANFELISLTNVWKVFKDVNHDACMFVARKRVGPNDTPTRATVCHLARGLSEAEKWQRIAEQRFEQSFEVDTSQWLAEPDCRFETMYPPDLCAILDGVAARAEPLGELCDVTVGIQAYHRRKVSQEVIEQRAFHADHRKGPGWHPYITGNEIQRYFATPASNAFLRYGEDLCDKRPLEHYAEPRILIQQIFWNRIAASFQTPEEPLLYLNTLFSCSAPREGTPIGYLLAVLNSRIASAAYERWANRIFGDKFPKLSKIDLARFPVPKATARTKHALHRHALELSKDWSELKRAVTSFQDAARVLDASGGLDKRLRKYWKLGRAEVIDALAAAKARSPARVERFMEAWSSAVSTIDARWKKILAAEDHVEGLVQKAYGLSDAACDRLLARVPATTLDDVLLPK
jgi:hypothetical protein